MPVNRQALLWGVVFLALLGLPVALNKPRGERNKNPMNLRPLASGTWDGQTGLDTAPGGPFVVFGDVQGQPGEFWGVRAGAKLLLNYQRRYGLYNLAGIIDRFAPSSENDTNAYSDAVAGAVGVSPTEPVDLIGNPTLHQAVVKAMIRHEQGRVSVPDDLLAQAVTAARLS